MYTTDRPLTLADLQPPRGVDVPRHHGRTLVEQMFDVVIKYVDVFLNSQANNLVALGRASAASEVLAIFLNSQAPPSGEVIINLAQEAIKIRDAKPKKVLRKRVQDDGRRTEPVRKLRPRRS